LKTQLEIESVLKEMIIVEDKAKEILSQGEKLASEVLSNAHQKSQALIEESIQKAKKEESIIIETARLTAEKKKEAEINELTKQNQTILAQAEKRKDKVYDYIIKWLKNDI